MIRRSTSGVLLGFLSLLTAPARSEPPPEGFAVTGSVLEKGSRRPLSGAYVLVAGNEELAATTELDGTYRLVLGRAGTYTLEAAALGYAKAAPAEVTVGTNLPEAQVTFHLQPELILPAVEVRAERSPDRVSKRVVTREEVTGAPGTGGDPLRVLQSLPGVAAPSDAVSAPAIRGSRPEDNAYYADFMPLEYLFHVGGAVSVLPADLVNDFNLYAAAFGPEYADVTGGVVDVGLRDPRTDRLGGRVSVGLLGADALVEGPVSKNQSFFLAGRRSYLDLVLGRMETEKGVTVSVPEYYDYQAKYVWVPGEDSRVRLLLLGAGDKIGFKIDKDSDTAQQQPVLAGDSAIDDDFHSQSLVWDRRLSGGITNRLGLGHRHLSERTGIGSAADSQVGVDTLLGREELRWAAGDHEVTAGGELQTLRVNLSIDARKVTCTEFDPDCDLTGAPEAMLNDRLRVNEWAGYAKDRWRVADGVRLIGGLRYSADDYLDRAYLEPRLGLEWQAAEGTLLSAGWGRHSQFPGGNQVIDEFGNPHLRRLRAEHTTVGLSQKVGAEWLVDVQAYYKRLWDLVSSDPETNFTNGGEGRAYGVELLVKREPTARLSGWLSVTASRSVREGEATGETFPFDYDQPLIATWVATYRLSPAWKFGLRWQYHSGTPFTPIVGTVVSTDGRIRPRYGDLNSERLPAYHRLDLRADRTWAFDAWKLGLYVELLNAYNRKNVLGYRYNADYTDRDPVYQLPLIPSVGVQAEF
ncbi:MAG: TonB-dependent receptor [Deltaproteobacteria bacterium]|nr:TonB-dependent receptor [Deltaproteobacteria bacterium]